MIPALRLRGLNHIALANLKAAGAPIGMSAFGQSGKHLLDQSIAGFDPERSRVNSRIQVVCAAAAHCA